MSLSSLFRNGPPTALVLTSDWREVVKLQIRLENEHPDTTFVHIRGKKMRTAAGFFDEALAAALQFPVWFGANWDAVTDLVRDRGWLAAMVLGIYDAHELLADATERDRRNLADLLERCNREGREPGTPSAADHEDGFHVLAQVPPGEAGAVLARWRDVGLTIVELPAQT